MSAAEELLVAWSPPGGRMPPHCLEYEVQVAEDVGEATAAWAVGTAPGVPQGGEGAVGRHRLQQGVGYPGQGLCTDSAGAAGGNR